MTPGDRPDALPERVCCSEPQASSHNNEEIHMSKISSVIQMIEDCHAQALQAVSGAHAAGFPAEELCVLVLDTGSRVGGDPGLLIRGFQRDELRELSDVPREAMIERYENRCPHGDPSEVHSASLELLLGPLREFALRPVLPGELLVIAQHGTEVAAVARTLGSGRHLN
jgi:hypothetical protein